MPCAGKVPPPGNKGNILITSRNKVFGRLTTNENSLEVGQMGEEEAISLLWKSSMLGSRFDQDKAKRIVAALGSIPLAVDQAGAYILSCGCSLDTYLELYLKQRERLMSGPKFKGASDYGYSTYGTWEISMHEIERKATNNSGWQQRAAQSALMLFRIFAFFHHEGISEDILRVAGQNYWKRRNEKNELPCSIGVLDSETLF